MVVRARPEFVSHPPIYENLELKNWGFFTRKNWNVIDDNRARLLDPRY